MANDCLALYCRCCALKQRTCQWDSINSPGFHRHYQCTDCRPQYRIPPVSASPATTVGPFPTPYAYKRYRASATSYNPVIPPKRTINQMEAQSEENDEDYEDMLRVAFSDA